ncbi:DNA helicase [Candidatus Methylobacter favarea]|uniref:DNA 3'-5' helicase n=1 Tax=Candidatus Methylobacter favarea TaxID=2707345 RepID=A0A8S0XUQ9_9GAMM|nr:ATP-dependent helicase [Candidatus Methylobacter favarea]CAA9892388.1 DNA helicase [Candidatus Methylobacter favarea]
MEKLLVKTNLDNTQQAFCLDSDKALRLLAPAGSGKTYSLLWRCLTAIRQATVKEEAARVLIFTFTRVARDELRDRVRTNPTFKALDGSVEVNTLNAWSFRWLKSRVHNPRLVTSSKERVFLIKNNLQPIWQKHPAIKDLLTDSKRKFKAEKGMMDQIDFMKSLGFRHDKHNTPAAFRKHLQWLVEAGLQSHVIAFLDEMQELEITDRKASYNKVIDQIFDRFMGFWIEAIEHLYQTATLSFEDQKYWTVIHLEKALAEKKFTTGIARYHHILVDEFQDIGPLDLNLLDLVAKINKTQLCIVGDDDQAIYEWRGASPDFILQPNKFISSDYKTHILEVNYRCPKNVVELSQRLIQHNKRRVPKNVTAASTAVAQIDVVSSPAVDTSVDYVLNMVRQLLEDNTIGNVALISRKRSQLIPYQIIFAGSDIPFYAAEDLSILLSSTFDELKQLLVTKAQSTMQTPFAPDPIEGLLKLCDKVKRYPVKKEDRGAIKSFFLAQRPRSLVDALITFYSYTGPLKGDNRGGAMTKEFYGAIRSFLHADSVSAAIEALSLEFDGLQKDYGKSLDDIFYADPPFLYLSAYAERYGDDYAAFYEDVEKAISTLVRTSPEDDESAGDLSWKRKLHLMTALRTKGKEFDVVVILDCNQDIWPSKLAITDEQQEAERRLFYVAFTRAKKHIVLMVNDQMFQELAIPSPYIEEMGLSINRTVE